MRLEELSSLQQLVLPDRWQAEAIQALRAGKDVIVDAPTGAGKTYVFERWAEQTNFSRRALFTVPTRALANDKYAEWSSRGWRAGITTGDVTVDPGAPLIVGTLEGVANRVNLSPPQIEEMYRYMAIANFEDRFVIPTAHREVSGDAQDLKGSCGFSFGNGCSDGTTSANLFSVPKKHKIPEPAGR